MGRMTLVYLAVGGALGAISRHVVQTWLQDLVGGRFPWGTFVINISGSFVLGLLFALAIERELLTPEIRLPVMVGFLGAYTTFSTYMLESWALAEAGDLSRMLFYLVGSVIVGMLAVVAGLALGRSLF